MKKALVLVLMLAVMLMPMSVYAELADLGSADNPYLLSTADTRLAVNVPAEATVWVQVDDANGSTLTVGYATSADYIIMYCMQPTYAETTSGDNTATVTMVSGADMFSVYNPGAETVTLYMSLTAGAGGSTAGTMDEPEVITLTTNMFGGLGAYVSTELAEGNQGYYYTLTAPDDGVISVGVDAVDADYNFIGWTYFVNNITSSRYGETHWSDDAEPAYYEEVKVSEGDELQIFAATYDPMSWTNPAGTVSVSVDFSPVGSRYCPVEVNANTSVKTDFDAGNMGYFYTWTATETGTATVAIDTESTTCGWQYNVDGVMADGTYMYGDVHWSDDETVVSSEEIEVVAGDKLNICVATYDPMSWTAPAGSVYWSLTFEAGEIGGGDDGDGDGDDIGGGDIGGDDEGEVNYVNSDTLLAVGTGSYAVDPMYTYTVFTFEPTETGKYTITSADSKLGIVSYNGMWVSVDPSAETVSENTVVWDCSGVGQSIWVAVLADSNVANITVSREELVIDMVETIIYENKVTPESFTYAGNVDELEYVDTFDTVVDEAVLGEDGRYHLNSADGPVLYVDLDDTLMNLVDALGYGQIKEVIYDENDMAVAVVDYNEAFTEYYNCADVNSALYPLTEDLMEIYKNVGKNYNWYGEGGWVGGNEADAWMFACYYNVNDTGSGATGTPGGSDDGATTPGAGAGDSATGTPGAGQTGSAPQTGDNLFFVIALAVMALAACATIVVVRKRNTAK